MTTAMMNNTTRSILLFTQSKEMPRKTRKVSRKHRRRTLRRIHKKGGADTQALKIPSDGFKTPGNPINSDNAWYKIA
jgi:hypothetical protein